MRRLSAVLAFAMSLTKPASVFALSPSLRLTGFLSARTIYVTSQPSWLAGGFGRFDVGADEPGDHRLVNVEVAQLGGDWTPSTWLLVHADGLARREPSGTKGRRLGLVQAYAELHNEHWRLRGGSFWLPTSRENIDSLWTSPYTITYSALNTWIGEEVRPVGLDLQYSPNFYVTLGATAFRGNDTMGTLLASRGWTFGNRLTVYDEALPLAPPEEHMTKPVTRDLDDENGYAARLRVQLPERAMLQFTRIDNRAPLVPELRGQEPWLTRFNIISGEIGTTSPTTVAAEWAYGSTALGYGAGVFTLDFDTTYLLVSHKTGADRWTARVERFSTRDHDFPDVALSREDGHAVTVAWLRDVQPNVRAGLEYARVKGNRPGAAEVGADPRSGGSTITVDVRYRF